MVTVSHVYDWLDTHERNSDGLFLVFGHKKTRLTSVKRVLIYAIRSLCSRFSYWNGSCFNSRRASWNDINVRPTGATRTEFYRAINQSKQRIVFTQTNVFARMMFGAALANNDIAGNGRLATEQLNTQAFADRITAVFGTTYTFLVCHFF